MRVYVFATIALAKQRDRGLRDAAGEFNRWTMRVMALRDRSKIAEPTHKFDISVPKLDTGMWFWADGFGVSWARPLDGKIYGVGALRAETRLAPEVIPVLRVAAAQWSADESRDKWRSRVEGLLREAFGVGQRQLQ